MKISDRIQAAIDAQHAGRLGEKQAELLAEVARRYLASRGDWRDPIEIQKSTWPDVRDAIRARRARTGPMRGLAGMVHQATIAHLAREGLLTTEKVRVLLDALDAYWDDEEPNPDEPDEVRLYEAWSDYNKECDDADLDVPA